MRRSFEETNFTMKSRDLFILVALIVFCLIASSTFFVADQTKVYAVFQMGKPIVGYNGALEAGLKFKWPFPFQSVKSETNRYFLYDSSPKEALTDDKKMLIVDEFMPARIVNPIKFFVTVKSIAGAQARIDDTAYSFLNNILGAEKYERIVVTNRDDILDAVTKITQAAISDFGLETPMVRVSRVDLPAQNTQAVFARMVSERNQEAAKYRGEGAREKRRISSGADSEAVKIREEARREAQSILGKADEEAIKIFNSASAKDPEFFKFYFSLDAARQAFGEGGIKEKLFVLKGDETLLKPVFK